jgi:cytochrome c oxidase accessory protein FixG
VTGVGFSLFYVTALLGRVWCGWACPQTVLLDITRRIERWLEGDAAERQRLSHAPRTFRNALCGGLKHGLYAIFALIVAHVFLSYFVSLQQLYAMMREFPGKNWGAFLLVFGIGGALWFNFAWFREQFCIVLCPYGRLQSALIDSHSIVIGYDSRRGEPRGRKGTPGAGDCVNCLRCVQVCPTGIDIRHGLQMECIGCAACVDACDAVMDKLGRPRGLVRYDSLNGLSGKPTRWIRPRILVYSALLLLGAIAMTAGLSTLRSASVTLNRITGAPYFIDQDVIRNQFVIRVLNKRNTPSAFRFQVVDAPAGLIATGADTEFLVPALGETMRPLVLTLPRSAFAREFPVSLRLVTADGRTVLQRTLPFVGPGS